MEKIVLAINYLVIFFVTAAILIPYLVLRAKKKEFNFGLLLKILSIILISAFVIRYMSGPDAIQETVALTNDVFTSSAKVFVSILLNWFLIAIVLFLTLISFFKIKNTHLFICLFVLPVSILCAVFYVWLGQGIVGADGFSGFNFRLTLMAIEIGICLAYAIVYTIEKLKYTALSNEGEVAKGFGKKKDYLSLLFIIPMLLATMPPYVIQALFGFSDSIMEVKDFTLSHRIILYIGLMLPLLIWYVLKKKDDKTIKFALLFISLGTLISFSLGHKFASFLNVTAWPFHLCNTAMYIVPLCILFKWDKLFYFTYFINIFGAFAAMAMPNYADATNLFGTSLVNFYINHYIAFFMPIIMVSLRLYDRPKLKQFIYSMCGFGIYFVFVLILNAWFSNYGTVDYFFVNSDFIASKLGSWAENLLDFQWSFNIANLKFVFYPLYQFLFFLGYVVIGLGMWFIYEQGYAFADSLGDIIQRKKKIKADALALEYSKAHKEEKMLKDGPIKLELKNFSKRYGNSKVYAVKNANLVINGGEIFGFLGHNGAGKSTIIKSIVGIQPITSGSIEVCGYDVDKEPVMAKRMIGFVPDHYALYEKLTGREYINYIADLWNVSQEERNAQIEKYVNLFELAGSFDNQIKTYSHGMKQKITIISALVHNPKVWILDEPLTGLDPNSIYQVKECMKQHTKEGNIVFFSSHIIDVVESICDRIAIIKKGEILTCKSLKEIEKDTTLEQFYLNTTQFGKVSETPDEELPENKNSEKPELPEEKSDTKKEAKSKKASKVAK